MDAPTVPFHDLGTRQSELFDLGCTFHILQLLFHKPYSVSTAKSESDAVVEKILDRPSTLANFRIDEMAPHSSKKARQLSSTCSNLY